ncbi:unnamed protein product [Strongylus vulgaris]|uniref:Uncharacterized protein n=1 Tax=Strongylus vulgaris TaxID=40348 RepID=A0A3P7I0D3_STRVU|nr:unnamed protein product [Strongylus vulgaris]
MSEIAERYVEQIQTTAETLRRRIVAYYDGVFFLGSKIVTAADRARDIAEPVAYDVKDYVVNASNQNEPVSEMEKDTKNNVVELYLGVSVSEEKCMPLSSLLTMLCLGSNAWNFIRRTRWSVCISRLARKNFRSFYGIYYTGSRANLCIPEYQKKCR